MALKYEMLFDPGNVQPECICHNFLRASAAGTDRIITYRLLCKPLIIQVLKLVSLTKS